jgi:hypothetical protein
MKCKSIFFLFLLIITGFQSFSQIEKPKKKVFNIGVSEALGGISYNSFPSVDLNYKSTMFRISPGFLAFSAGISQEISHFSPAFFNCYWVGSVYYSVSAPNGIYAHKYLEKREETPDKSNRVAILTGAKVYFGKHWYSIAQLGIQYISHERYSSTFITGSGTPVLVIENEPKKEITPYFEFGIGFNIFKTYPTVEDISN